MQASDCVLVDDCCSCTAIPASDPPPDCQDTQCSSTMCSGAPFNAPSPDCIVGFCNANLVCNPAFVMCGQPEPVCPPGQAPVLLQKSACWGPCIPADDCDVVSSCDRCGPTQTCVHRLVGPSDTPHCIETPDVCVGNVTCACLGAAVCGGLPCDDASGDIVCGGQ